MDIGVLNEIMHIKKHPELMRAALQALDALLHAQKRSHAANVQDLF